MSNASALQDAQPLLISLDDLLSVEYRLPVRGRDTLFLYRKLLLRPGRNVTWLKSLSENLVHHLLAKSLVERETLDSSAPLERLQLACLLTFASSVSIPEGRYGKDSASSPAQHTSMALKPD
jgi:hypothetical protein